MSETWLYDDDSAVISVLTPESHVLHHVPRPDKKVVDSIASLTNHCNLKNSIQNVSSLSSLWKFNYQMRDKKSF